MKHTTNFWCNYSDIQIFSLFLTSSRHKEYILFCLIYDGQSIHQSQISLEGFTFEPNLVRPPVACCKICLLSKARFYCKICVLLHFFLCWNLSSWVVIVVIPGLIYCCSHSRDIGKR